MTGGQSDRRQIRSPKGLQAGDSWIAEVKGGDSACDAVAAAAEAWKRANMAGAMSVGEDAAYTIAMRRTCFVTFTGPRALAEHLRANHPNVLTVEADLVVTAEARSWGLDRLDQADLPLNRADLTASHDGTGVNVYVIDTGINKDHDDFQGRAKYGASFISGEAETDGNGHGTHCAGTVGGSTYGIARRATIFGVKALSRTGSGSTSGVINGVNWAVKNQMNLYNGESAVLSLSLGGGRSSAMNRAAQEAAEDGMIVVVAAGNEAQDACNTSPAGAGGNAQRGGPISVGATTRTDTMSSFSNFGRCTDVFAPGSSITSAWVGSTSAVATVSGTSMATPHVAGVAAILLQKHGKDKPAAQSELMALLVAGRIRGVPPDTPNLLLQVPTYTGPPTPPTQSPTMPPTRAAPTMCVGSTCAEFIMSIFGPRLPMVELLVAPLAVARESPIMCARTAEDFTGKVVIVERGDCIFFDKVKAAERQGARAVLIMLTAPFDFIFEPGYYGHDSTDIPSAMISQADGLALSALAGSTIVIGSPSNVAAAPSLTLSPTPSQTPRPTRTPTTPRPTRAPTPRPTRLPTQFPTARPTVACAALQERACKRTAACTWARARTRFACFDRGRGRGP